MTEYNDPLVDYDHYDFGYVPPLPDVAGLGASGSPVDSRGPRHMGLPRVETMEVLPEGEAVEGTVAQTE